MIMKHDKYWRWIADGMPEVDSDGPTIGLMHEDGTMLWGDDARELATKIAAHDNGDAWDELSDEQRAAAIAELMPDVREALEPDRPESEQAATEATRTAQLALQLDGPAVLELLDQVSGRALDSITLDDDDTRRVLDLVGSVIAKARAAERNGKEG